MSWIICKYCDYEWFHRDGVDIHAELIPDYLNKYDARIAELEHELSNKEIEYTDLWDDALALQSRIAELEEARRWIPVSERLPEFGAPILFYDSILERINKGTCTAMNSDNTNLHWFTDDDLFYFGNRSEYITHWMPLPQPPEVQE